MVSSSVCFGAIVFLIGVVCIAENQGYDLPAYMTPCYGLDSECLTRKGNEYLEEYSKGIPELGVRPFNPYHVDKMNVNIGGLLVKLKNIIVKGLGQCNIENIDISVETHKVKINLICNVTVDAKYETKGRLLLLNLEGNGDVNIKIKKMSIKVENGFAYEKRDGEYYMKLHKKYKQSSKVLGYAHFDLSNLFGGNKALGDPVLSFINQNWEQLYNEFSGPIVENAVGLAVENLNIFFNKFPRSVLTPGFDKLYKDQQ